MPHRRSALEQPSRRTLVMGVLMVRARSTHVTGSPPRPPAELRPCTVRRSVWTSGLCLDAFGSCHTEVGDLAAMASATRSASSSSSRTSVRARTRVAARPVGRTVGRADAQWALQRWFVAGRGLRERRADCRGRGPVLGAVVLSRSRILGDAPLQMDETYIKEDYSEPEYDLTRTQM